MRCGGIWDSPGPSSGSGPASAPRMHPARRKLRSSLPKSWLRYGQSVSHAGRAESWTNHCGLSSTLMCGYRL